MMRACFSESAVNVSDYSCTAGCKSSVINAKPPSSARSSSSSSSCSAVQTAITSLYRSQLSSQKELLIKVTWSKSHLGLALSLGVDVAPFSHNWNPNAVDSNLLRKRRGNRSYVSGRSVVSLYWDYSAASFGNSSTPEPISNFHVVIIVDAEFALVLGDLGSEVIRRFPDLVSVAEFSLVGRREQVLSQAVYSTKARFIDKGREHDIVVSCKGGGGDGCGDGDPELIVSIDDKRVVETKNLRWNFRGNQTIYIDGTAVDMMWDVKDWLFSAPQGCAAFMFRRRSALESRLWFEEEVLHREKGISGFSLLIQAFMNH